MAGNRNERRPGGGKGEETRNVLLTAAERIIIEQGVQALTIRQIGVVSGVAATLVTYHFGTLSQLMKELCRQNLDPILEAWEPLNKRDFASLREALEAWMVPLMAPSAFVPGGRALIVIDEVASHGDPDIREMVLQPMLDVSQQVRDCLAPFVPHLEQRVLRARVRFLSAATLGPPPRGYKPESEADDDLPHLDSTEYMLDFAEASLRN